MIAGMPWWQLLAVARPFAAMAGAIHRALVEALRLAPQ